MLIHNKQKDYKKPKWRYALLFALPVSGVIMVQFFYWFAIVDRYLVFLYFHDMGPIVPDTSPFSRVTASRYWMAGLVACGTILLLYTFANWVLGKKLKNFVPPSWKLVWLISAVILSFGIPAITMGVNYPRLPVSLAILVTVSTLIALALSLMPGGLAAKEPRRLVWLFADAWGIALLLWVMPHFIDIGNWFPTGFDWRTVIAVTMLLFACLWLIFLSIIEVWRNSIGEKIVSLVVAGLCVAYLLVPWLHYVFFSDTNRYITNSDNFFARNLPAQCLSWMMVVFIVWGIRRLRLFLTRKRSLVV